jgi:hypothetical protein
MREGIVILPTFNGVFRFNTPCTDTDHHRRLGDSNVSAGEAIGAVRALLRMQEWLPGRMRYLCHGR